MTYLVLGLTLGMLVVIPVGPVSLSVIAVGLAQGRSAGSYAGLGVVGGDAVTATLALIVVLLGSRLPDSVFTGLSWVTIAVLVAFGLVMMTRSESTHAIAASIKRPGRVLLGITVLSPLTFVSWVAMLMAMPFADEQSQLGLFAIGVVLASLCWHPLLGLGAGVFHAVLSESALTRLARVGGLAFLGLAGALLIKAL